MGCGGIAKAGTGAAAGSTAIAWIGGRWGAPEDLGIPLSDRGLLLADGLFETVLVEKGRPLLLEAHLSRWNQSAALLGMEKPPDRSLLDPLIAEAIVRFTAQGETSAGGALRLNWSRGSPTGESPVAARGINLPAAFEPPLPHRFWLQLTAAKASFTPVTVMISHQERRNAHSLLSRCKTFAYGQAIQARREARAAGAEDALLLGSSGQLCCGTTANLLIRRAGRWLTPPLASGCLPGVMRGRALELGLAQEKRLSRADLNTAEALLLINSMGCRPITALDGRPLAPWSRPEALFRLMLGSLS